MITKIHFGAFKSHLDSELPLEPLTILVGTNASGKTNAVEGLILLSSISTGAEISHSIESTEGHIRGESKYCAPFGSQKLSLGCEFVASLKDRSDTYHYQIDIETESIPFVRYEAINTIIENGHYKIPPLFKAEYPNEALQSIRVAVDNFAQGGTKPGFDFNARIPVLFQLLPIISTDIRFKNNRKSEWVISQHKNITQSLLSSLSSITVLDPKPELIRKSGYVAMETKKMDHLGLNLSGVLYNLCQDPKKKEEILNLFKTLPEHEIKNIDFISTQRNEVQLIIKEKFRGVEKEVPLELLSDGTIRMLVLLAAAFSMQKGGLMVIEEVDTSLHPSKVDRLLEKLMDVARTNEARLLVTTHNPALLDAIKPRNYDSVVICYREDKNSNSKFIKLNDIPDIEELFLREKLGGLITKRLYDKLLRRSEADRMSHKNQIALDWLQMMEDN